MSVSVNLKLTTKAGNLDRLVRTEFLRRDYDNTHEQDVTVTSQRTLIKSPVSDIQFIYIKVKSGGPVRLYKNRNPDYITFSDTALILECSDISSIALYGDAEVYLFLAGQ